MADKKSKKEKAKEFVKNNKKKCICAALVVIAGVAYVFFDYDLNIDKVADVVCSWIGGC